MSGHFFANLRLTSYSSFATNATYAMSRPRKSITESKAVQTGFRLEIALKRELDDIARREDITVTQIIRRAVREFIERDKSKVAA